MNLLRLLFLKGHHGMTASEARAYQLGRDDMLKDIARAVRPSDAGTHNTLYATPPDEAALIEQAFPRRPERVTPRSTDAIAEAFEDLPPEART